MQILLRLCIFLIGLSYSLAQVITIKLTEIDASFVLDGTRLEDSKAIMLLVETDDNSMIMLNSWFGSQNETKFIVQDGITNYSSTALPPEAVFQQNLALDNLELNKNYQFWMIFRRLEGKNLTDPVLSTDHTIYYIPNAIEDYQVSVNKANKTQFFTFIHTLGSPSPQLYVWPYVAPNPNDCTITLYSGGIPSQVGAEKYDIFEFGATDPFERRFAKSLIAGFAATVEVPPNCAADIWAQTADGWDVANELEMVATNEGFVMSQGYPFLATELSDKPSEIQAIYKVDDSEKYADQTTFHVELLHFDAGTPAGKLYLEIGTETQLILSSSTSQLSFSGHGPSFSVYFDTNDGSGNFLVRFTSYTEQEPSSNTTTLIPTEPTKKPATTERKTEATKDTTNVDVHSTDVTTSRGGTKSTRAPAESTPVSSGAPSGSSEPTKPTGIKTTTQSGSKISLALCNFCLVLALLQ